ncbi:MAG: hypothetical protein LBK47_02365 [Prevotellaceae bacterium]|jgi:hypothetical protein|nr:hypothetical protein [Prevotellaceae bacterium]
MTICYVCGCSGATYRRKVYTGHSVGTYTGKDSYGNGVRSNYGVRSVCKQCAARIDEDMTRNELALLHLLQLL